MNTILRNQISNDILAAYGSPLSPNWSFVKNRYHANMYSELLEAFSDVGSMQESTDLNDDVCVVTFVDFGDGSGICVRLSLVGRYACVSDERGKFFGKDSLECDIRTAKIKKVLDENKFTVLDPADLRKQFEFGEGLATVYDILFSTDEAID